jgi:hypothetical protein
MTRGESTTRVALPPDVAEWMGVWDDVAEPSLVADAEPLAVPAQRSWRERMHLTSRHRH